MSNYFQLIQNVSKEFIGKAPSSFSDVTDKKYKDIIKEIGESVNDFMLDSCHKFRQKRASFQTVEDQQGYAHIYGNIIEKGLMITNDDGSKSYLGFDDDWQSFILNETVEANKPNKYTVALGQLLLSPTPDDAYTMTVLFLTQNFIKGIYTTDAESAAEQKNVYLASTAGLLAGMYITIEPGTPREETVLVASVTTNDYITSTTDLINTHASSSTIETYKTSFEYETDEPNFPTLFHKIIEYMALMRLYYDDQENLRKYTQQYVNLYKSITQESKGSTESKLRFIV